TCALPIYRIEAVVRSVGGMIFVLGDFNSHHTMWGSARSFDRGPKVCNFISACDLHLLNNGDLPTFYTVRDGVECQSHIDLSLASTDLLDSIQSWEVKDGITTSDHQTILIHLQLGLCDDVVPSGTRRFITRSVPWDKCICLVCDRAIEWRRQLDRVSCRDDVDVAATTILTDLINICEH